MSIPEKMRLVASPTGTLVYDEDGKLIKGVTRIEFDHQVRGVPRLRLTMFARVVEIEGYAHVMRTPWMSFRWQLQELGRKVAGWLGRGAGRIGT